MKADQTGQTQPIYAVYVLECADGTLYTGITTDIERRVAEHNGEQGGGKGAKYTKVRRPVALRYSEQCGTKGQALRREYALKSLSRAEKLKLLS